MPDREEPQPASPPGGGDPPREVRATILASVDDDDVEALEAAEAWFDRWRSRLSYCSEDQGCGCCVHIWDVAGPAEAIEAIPHGLTAMSAWTHPELASSPDVPRASATRPSPPAPARRRRRIRKWKHRPPPAE